MSLIQLHNNLKQIDVVGIMVEVLDSLEDFIADLNRTQLAAGLRGDGTEIKPEYENITKSIKSDKSGIGGIIDHVTLYGEGPFYKSIFSTVFPDEIILDSKDSKLGKLEEKYNDKILGLTKESIKKLKAKVLPIFWRKFDESICK